VDILDNALFVVFFPGIDYMFLVGGFAESPILQFEMRRDFEHLLKIIIPQEVSLTILKGDVLLLKFICKLSIQISTSLIWFN
jgi:hypothetical protein